MASLASPGPGSASLGRISDVWEDGGLRGSLAGFFPAGLPVLSLEKAVAPFSHLCAADLDNNIKIARKHAAKKKVAEAFPDLSEDERAALTLYTMESHPREQSVYFLLNLALRAHDRGAVRLYRDYIWLIMHALRHLPPSPETTAHRAMKCALSDLGGDYDQGDEVQWSGFSSVSFDLAAMNTFLGKTGPRILFNIELWPRVARDLRRLSIYPGEKELLLPPSSLFLIKGVLDAGNGLIVFQLQMLDPLDAILSLSAAPVVWECEADAGRWVTVKALRYTAKALRCCPPRDTSDF